MDCVESFADTQEVFKIKLSQVNALKAQTALVTNAALLPFIELAFASLLLAPVMPESELPENILGHVHVRSAAFRQ